MRSIIAALWAHNSPHRGTIRCCDSCENDRSPFKLFFFLVGFLSFIYLLMCYT